MKLKRAAFFLLLVILSCSKENLIEDEVLKTFPEIIPVSIEKKVGKSIEIEMPWNGSIAEVYFSSIHSNFSLQPEITAEKIKVIIPAHMCVSSGSYQVFAFNKNEKAVLAKVILKSLEVEGIITSFIGPKSIKNNAKEVSELTYFPKDRFGNPSAHDFTLQFAKSDDGVITRQAAKVKDKYGLLELSSDKGQRINIGISNKKANSNEHQIRTLSLCPEYIEINHDEILSIANGRQFFKVWTNFLVDKNGQQVAEGSIVLFEILNNENERVGLYKAYTTNGIATTYIRNPSLPGNYILKVSTCGIERRKEIGPFTSMVSKFDYQWSAKGVLIGPVTNELGQYVANGTQVRLKIGDTNQEQVLSKITVNGFVEFSWDEFWQSSEPSKAIVEINNLVYAINPNFI